jgi:uncharacterized protein YbjT (DUF2867 family)
MKKTAIVIGATGMVGKSLVDQLLADPQFELVKVFVRRSTGISHAKLKEFIINFDQPLEWKHEVQGDVLFSTLGTTLRQAGSKSSQYKIDHTYQYQFALAASENKVPVYVLVSSYGASEKSMVFYSQMKGKLETDISKLSFQHIHILQPGMLEGSRDKKRMAEGMGISLLHFLNRFGILKSQKPVPAKIVARAMINASGKLNQRVSKWPLLKVFELAG